MPCFLVVGVMDGGALDKAVHMTLCHMKLKHLNLLENALG